TIAEVNRITRVGGWLLLSTPNCSSLRSVIKTLRGEHPYIWCPYSTDGNRDRHNREYTPQEVRLLLESAGYEVDEMVTRNDSYSVKSLGRRALRRFVAWFVAVAGLATGRWVGPALRGECIFALAHKCGPIKVRFPEFLYY